MEALWKVRLRKEGERGVVQVTGVRDGEEDGGQDCKKPEKMPSLLNTLGRNTKGPQKKSVNPHAEEASWSFCSENVGRS